MAKASLIMPAHMDYTDQSRESDGRAREGDASGRGEEGGKREGDETSEQGSRNRTEAKIINTREKRAQRTKRGRMGTSRRGAAIRMTRQEDT